MTIEALSADKLACERGGRTIISNVTFEVRKGHALILRGPNGSGKTTLLRTLAGFLSLAAGEVSVRRGDGSALLRDEADIIHFIGHANGVKPRLSVFENVSFWQRYYGGGAEPEIAEDALDAFGLLHLADYRAAHLSAGQARRLGLARLLTAERPIWLLDEPSVSLDAASVRLLEAAIARHLAKGGLAIVSTHTDLNLPEVDVLRLGGESEAACS